MKNDPEKSDMAKDRGDRMRGRDPADLTWNTLEGIADPIYTADDLQGLHI